MLDLGRGRGGPRAGGAQGGAGTPQPIDHRCDGAPAGSSRSHRPAAICLAQLEIIHEQVARRDRMIRLMSKLIGEIPGVTPLPIPEFVDVYSAWMFTMSIDPAQFTCTVDEFAKQLVDAGVPMREAGGTT